jgi:hypothetical protein
VSGQHHSPADLLPGKEPDTHWIRGWLDPRAGLDDKHDLKINYKSNNDNSSGIKEEVQFILLILNLQKKKKDQEPKYCVALATGYRLYGRGSIAARARDSLHYSIQTDSRAH